MLKLRNKTTKPVGWSVDISSKLLQLLMANTLQDEYKLRGGQTLQVVSPLFSVETQQHPVNLHF